jgi:hypothetical protein
MRWKLDPSLFHFPNLMTYMAAALNYLANLGK